MVLTWNRQGISTGGNKGRILQSYVFPKHFPSNALSPGFVPLIFLFPSSSLSHLSNSPIFKFNPTNTRTVCIPSEKNLPFTSKLCLITSPTFRPQLKPLDGRMYYASAVGIWTREMILGEEEEEIVEVCIILKE